MSKGKLNIYRDNFLEKEELDRLMNFIRDNPALFLFVSNAQSFGIIQQGASLSVDPAFKVEVGTNSNTIKIVTDSYALDVNGEMIYQRAFDNLPIATDSYWYWVKISHRADNYEQGYVDIAADGTLSGAGTLFTEVLRGSSSGFPVKVKFFVQADDGSLSAANNSGIYEVVSVAGDNTAVIAGNVTGESHLRYVVLGAFSIKTSVAAITSTGIYSYDSCNIEFILEEVSDTPPTTGFTADEEFYIARIMSDGVTVTVQDKRTDYYFRLNFGDIIVSNKANIDASNLDAPSIVLWLAALNVYTQTQVDAAVALLMAKAQNLNDVANKTTARSNLGVYSTTYLDAALALLMVKANNLSDVANVATSRSNLSVYSKAEVDAATVLLMARAQNLQDVADKPTARSNLDVYQTGVVDAAIALLMVKSQNLNDVADKSTARSNLSVYSKAEIDAWGLLITKVVNIGDWNMYVTGGGTGSATKSIAHGIADYTKIRSVEVIICHDVAAAIYVLNGYSEVLGSPVAYGGVDNIDATYVNLYAAVGGLFDNANFNTIPFNRGYVKITYTV